MVTEIKDSSYWSLQNKEEARSIAISWKNQQPMKLKSGKILSKVKVSQILGEKMKQI